MEDHDLATETPAEEEQQLLDTPQDPVEEAGGEDEDDQSVVYTLDGVVMRTIQIEGEDQQYLMDPENKIYDM